MKDWIKQFINSKKAVAMIVGVIMAGFGKKMGLDEDSVTKIIAALAAYMVAQGAADFGKEAAKVRA